MRRAFMPSTIAGLTAALTILAGTAPASAAAVERTYAAPFEATDAYLSTCSQPQCEGEASAAADGDVAAAVALVGGPGAHEHGYGSVRMTHVLAEPASEVTFEVRLQLEHAHAKALGILGASADATITLEAWHAGCSACFAYVREAVATARAPYAQMHREGLDLTLTATGGAGPRVVPAGAYDVSVTVEASVTTMPPHAAESGTATAGPAAAREAFCGSSCLGAGQVEAQISALIHRVTVTEQ